MPMTDTDRIKAEFRNQPRGALLNEIARLNFLLSDSKQEAAHWLAELCEEQAKYRRALALSAQIEKKGQLAQTNVKDLNRLVSEMDDTSVKLRIAAEVGLAFISMHTGNGVSSELRGRFDEHLDNPELAREYIEFLI